MTTKVKYPLLDLYARIARQKGDTFARAPKSKAAASGRAQAVARRILIDENRDRYDELYDQALAEITTCFPDLPDGPVSHAVPRDEIREGFVPVIKKLKKTK